MATGIGYALFKLLIITVLVIVGIIFLPSPFIAIGLYLIGVFMAFFFALSGEKKIKARSGKYNFGNVLLNTLLSWLYIAGYFLAY